MTGGGSQDARPVGRGPHAALDVHAHAMPCPLLQRLADQGLADLASVPAAWSGSTPRVSGVGP